MSCMQGAGPSGPVMVLVGPVLLPVASLGGENHGYPGPRLLRQASSDDSKPFVGESGGLGVFCFLIIWAHRNTTAST